MPNDLLVTTTDILGIEVAKEYSGASGIYVDNENNVISITGEVGKEYNGIEPIVVNNEENLISANSAPIGVQEPLYFVQDDDEAVIIGLSGEYVTPSDITGKLDTSSFESWQQGQYTNDLTAINEKINEVSSNIPSIEGLATEQLVEETSANIVSQIPSTAGLASETYVQEQTSAKASKSDLETVSGDIVNLIPDVSNYYTKDETSGAAQLAEAFSQIGPGGDEEVNTLVHSNSATWNEVSSKLDESTFQEASGLFLTAIPQEYITESDIPNFISAKLDTSSFADVSGSFLTAHQSLEGYATEQFVEDTSASITALIPTDYYPNSNPSGFITGVDLSNYYQKNETSSKEEISAAIAAIPLGDEEVNQAVHTNSATWNTVTDKLDTTAFSEVSGTFLTAHQSLDGYATETLVEETSGAITSLIPTDYYPDTNPSGFISGVDLSPYQTIEGMTAYQPVGDYATTGEVDTLSSMLSAAIDYVSANAGDEFPVSADEAVQYVQTNSAGIDGAVNSVRTNSGAWGGEALPISSRDGLDLEVDNGTLYIGASALTGTIHAYEQNSASYLVENNFEYDGNDLITAYNGSAFAGQGGGGGGGDVPTGTMNVTGLEYNAVNEISGYNGSAIAQYGAAKQWLVHDDTLVHASNSAQYALGVAIDNVARLMGVDETVLFNGDLTGNGSTAQLSEPITNFERIKVYGHTDDGMNCPWFTEFYPVENTMDVGAAANNAGWGKWFNFTITTGGLYTNVTGRVLTFGSTTWGNLSNWGTTKVIGIGRKQ